MSRERDRLGPLLETFVLQELRRQASWHPDPIDLFHYRDRDGFEVDVVLERGSTAVAGVEVKAAASVNDADFRGLRKLREAAGRRFATGVVLPTTARQRCASATTSLRCRCGACGRIRERTRIER